MVERGTGAGHRSDWRYDRELIGVIAVVGVEDGQGGLLVAFRSQKWRRSWVF